MNIFTFSRPTRVFLHYGLFAVICHITAIMFVVLPLPHTSLVWVSRVFPMVEHSLMSLVILLFGALGLEYIDKASE